MTQAKRRVLDVGQCVPDHYAIQALIEDHFNVDVEPADTADAAFDAAVSGGYALILVNRVIDADGDSGLELIRRLLADDATRSVPVMLITNYPAAQAEAAALGAQPGFGKANLHDPATVDRLAQHLGAP